MLDVVQCGVTSLPISRLSGGIAEYPPYGLAPAISAVTVIHSRLSMLYLP